MEKTKLNKKENLDRNLSYGMQIVLAKVYTRVYGIFATVHVSM